VSNITHSGTAYIRYATLVLAFSAALGPSTLGSQAVNTARVRAARALRDARVERRCRRATHHRQMFAASRCSVDGR
jgi:hypothetical protein